MARSGLTQGSILTTPLLILAAALAALVLVVAFILQSSRRERSLPSLLDERRERAAVEAALAETEEQSRSIVSSAPDGLVSTDPSGVIQSMNPAAEAMFARAAREVIGSGVGLLLDTTGDPTGGTEGVTKALRRSASAGRDVDLVGIRGAEYFPVEVRASVARPSGDLILVTRDVTEQRLAEREERALRTVATSVASGTEPTVVFDLVAEEAGQLFDALGAYVARCASARGDIVGRWGVFEHDERPEIELGPNDACGQAARTGKPAIIHNAQEAEDSPMSAHGVHSAMAVPIRVDGELWGVIGVATTDPDAFRPGSEKPLARLAEFISMAIANADARARLVASAATDELTGLPNQRSFHERLEAEVRRAHRNGHRLSLALFDVDRFKAVNDSHGHQVGDGVLVEIAERLTKIKRTADVVARVGGEEFGWIMVDTDGLGAWRAADRARAVVEETPFPQVGAVTISGGLCELAPAGNAGELFRLADIALYWAKAQGRNVCFRYSPDVIEVLSADERSEQMERVQRVGSIMGLAHAVDAKDPSTQRHSERVASLAARLARTLGWNEQRTALLHEAALVHDVGKIALPDALLVKPSRLTDAEYEWVKTHAELGARIVEGCLSEAQVAWVRGHHERFDGTGYPDRLRGTDISEGARILALADAWDAMTEVRLFATARNQEDALAECRRFSGSQFWPEAVEALSELARDGHLVSPSKAGSAGTSMIEGPPQTSVVGTHGVEMSRLRSKVSDPAREFGHDVPDLR